MNIHALQGYLAISEAQEIMSVPFQIVTPQSNSVLIGLVQDSLVAAFKMTRKDVFVSRDKAMQLAMQIRYNYKKVDAELREAPFLYRKDGDDDSQFVNFLAGADPVAAAIRGSVAAVEGLLPPPAVLKGTTWSTGPDGKTKKVVHGPQWTGKQIFSWVFPATTSLQKSVRDAPASLVWSETEPKDEATAKATAAWRDDDNVVVIRRGELLCGQLCKSTVGRVSQGVIHAVWKDIGPWAAAKMISDAQRICTQWLLEDTMSISIKNCMVDEDVEARVTGMIADAMGRADAILKMPASEFVKEVKSSKLLQVRGGVCVLWLLLLRLTTRAPTFAATAAALHPLALRSTQSTRGHAGIRGPRSCSSIVCQPVEDAVKLGLVSKGPLATTAVGIQGVLPRRANLFLACQYQLGQCCQGAHAVKGPHA